MTYPFKVISRTDEGGATFAKAFVKHWKKFIKDRLFIETLIVFETRKGEILGASLTYLLKGEDGEQLVSIRLPTKAEDGSSLVPDDDMEFRMTLLKVMNQYKRCNTVMGRYDGNGNLSSYSIWERERQQRKLASEPRVS